MSTDGKSYEKWLEGWFIPPLTNQELEEIKARADNVSSSEVEHLVEEIEFLRWLLNGVVTRLEYVEQKLGTDLSMSNPESFFVRYGKEIVMSRT